METQPTIDLKTYNELKDQMGADFVEELVDTYCRETQGLVEKLQQALAEGDTAAFRRLAHSIKSSSLSLGALVFSEQARELEILAKTGDLTGVGPKVEQLAADFVRVQRSMKELKNEP